MVQSVYQDPNKKPESAWHSPSAGSGPQMTQQPAAAPTVPKPKPPQVNYGGPSTNQQPAAAPAYPSTGTVTTGQAYDANQNWNPTAKAKGPNPHAGFNADGYPSWMSPEAIQYDKANKAAMPKDWGYDGTSGWKKPAVDWKVDSLGHGWMVPKDQQFSPYMYDGWGDQTPYKYGSVPGASYNDKMQRIDANGNVIGANPPHLDANGRPVGGGAVTPGGGQPGQVPAVGGGQQPGQVAPPAGGGQGWFQPAASNPPGQVPAAGGGQAPPNQNYNPWNPSTGGAQERLPNQGYNPTGGGQQPGAGGSNYWDKTGFNLSDQQAGDIWKGLSGLWDNYLTNEWQTPGGTQNAMRKQGDMIQIQTPDGIREWTYNTNLPEGTNGQDWNARDFFSKNKDLFGDFWNSSLGWGYGNQGAQGGSVVEYPDNPLPGGSTYSPGAIDATMTPETAVNKGLGVAGAALDANLARDHTYPGFWGDSFNKYDAGAWAGKFPGFVDNEKLQQINIPGAYNGLSGGDYNRLEESLRKPGDIAAQDAFDTGSRNLNNFMGSTGMYGSSVMGQQANEGINRELMKARSTNAANAVANRYGMEQKDLQFGANYDLQRGDLARQQALDTWRAGTTDAGRLSDYNNNRFKFDFQNSEAARAESNMLKKAEFDNARTEQAWIDAINERMFNQGMTMAGGGTPLTQANQNYRLQQDAAKAGDTAGKWQTGMNVLGGLFGANNGGFNNSVAKGIWDWGSGLFDSNKKG